ncbi:TRAP transporter large permease [Roseovarius sp. SYSU LYC5161]|uniref:TRAP transporter large permease n=1 Tax=Roseovarius halophilus (ex Wu et al. 2025) TaxID=3376060 RepID=UPI00399962E7
MPEWIFAISLMFGSVLVLLMIGVPVAFSFLAVNIVGVLVFLGGEMGLMQMVRSMRSTAGQYSLVPIPLFVLMGEIMLQTGMAQKSIDAIDRLISKVPGRLSIVAVLGGTVFSSLSGSTLANAAVLGRTLFPQMKDRGYSSTIAIGPILAVGGIAMLIPPSGLGVLLGSLARISINDILIAAIVPGVMMAILFLGYIIIRCRISPEIAPPYEGPELTLRERILPIFTHVVPLLGVFVVVVGSMFAGIATPTESAALGVLATLVAAAAYRALSIKALILSVSETLKFSAMILLIICTSGTFSQILAFSGATQEMSQIVTGAGVSNTMLVIFMLGILIFLGCFMDQVSMMMLTLPIFMPIVSGIGVDPVWFGVLMLIALEISLTTPPFGLLLFLMQSVADRPLAMTTIYKAVLPFLLLEFLVLGILLFLPGTVSWLPDLLR